MSTSITINGQTYTLCAMPATPGPASIQIGMNDTVAVAESPYTRWEQTQIWPGGDYWDATVTMPPMYRSDAWAWEGFLAELRGRGNVLQLGDPRAKSPLGTAGGAPVVNSTDPSKNLPMTTALVTRGWAASKFRLLLPGDHFQIGYRLHRVTAIVNSDSGGAATLAIWPSLRETPADGAALVLANPVGLFRLSSNRRPIEASPSRLTTFSFACREAR